MKFGVQHDVPDALALQDSDSSSDFSMRVVPTSTGCFSRAGARSHRRRRSTFPSGAEDDVRLFDAQHLAVGRDHHDVELVDLVELGGFGLGRAGHAGKLVVQPEVVLKRDGGERLVFLADGDAFLGLDGLVQAIGPAAAGHQAPGELVDDDDFAVLDHVLDIALIQVCALMAVRRGASGPSSPGRRCCRCRAAPRSSPSPRR